MGDSEKLPDSGPNSYRFVEHRRYLDALLEALAVRQRVTLVLHDWGSGLGFDWANRHRNAVKGIAFMEAITAPQGKDHWDSMGMRPVLEALRGDAGEKMVLEENFFIEEILPKAIIRPLQRGNGGVSPTLHRTWRRSPADSDLAAADSDRGRTRRSE